MISIIIPIYNAEKYLRQCVESILSQTYQNFELILIDDGSLDESPAICNEYSRKDKRVLVIHQENSGVSVARNNGIEYAHGEWISFVDSDDWVEPDYIANFCLDDNTTDLIIQGLEFYDHRNGLYFKQIKLKDCLLSAQTDFKQIVEENNLLLSGYPYAKAYKKTLLGKDLRFDTSISYHEDHIFVLEAMAAARSISLVNSTSYKYRYYHTTNSLSTKQHPWQNLNIASNGMLSCIQKMSNRFLIKGSNYERKVLNFAYAPKITAVFNIFKNIKSSTEQKYALQTIINKEQLKHNYKPYKAKDILINYMLQYAPFAIQKLFFTSYIKYQSRHL